MGSVPKLLLFKGVGTFPEGMEMSIRTSWGFGVTGVLVSTNEDFVALKDVSESVHVVRYEEIHYIHLPPQKQSKDSLLSKKEQGSRPGETLPEKDHSQTLTTSS